MDTVLGLTRRPTLILLRDDLIKAARADNVPTGSSGRWRVERFVVPPRSIEGLRCSMLGRSVDPGNYTRLVRDQDTIMSDTPAELQDFLGVIRLCCDQVLVNGLGLGCFVRAVLLNPTVTRVTVIEHSTDVINLVGPSFEGDSRLQIIWADAMDWTPPKGVRYSVAWHDIWDNICTDNSPEIRRLKRKYCKRVDWQGAWSETKCLRLRRQA